MPVENGPDWSNQINWLRCCWKRVLLDLKSGLHVETSLVMLNNILGIEISALSFELQRLGRGLWGQSYVGSGSRASLSQGFTEQWHVVYATHCLSYLREKYFQSFKKQQQYLAQRKLNAHRNFIFLKGCIKVFSSCVPLSPLPPVVNPFSNFLFLVGADEG